MTNPADIGSMTDTVVRLLRRHATRHLAKVLQSLRPVDIADVFRRVQPTRWREIFDLVQPLEVQAEIFTELDENTLKIFLEQFTDPELAEYLSEISSDDAADILEVLPPERAQAVINATENPEGLSGAEELLQYDPETAGGIMVPDVFALPETMTVGDAVAELQTRSDELEMVFYLYVVNEHGHLVGVCSLRELVIISPEVPLGDIMATDVLRVATSEDQEAVARVVAQYDLLAVPVVDQSNKLVGMVTVDDVIDVIRQEATEDMLRMAGVSDADLMNRQTVFRAARSRVGWLAASFLGGITAVFVIAAFEETLEAVAALAAFIPITLGMGGNVGTQSSTIVTRGLALGHIDVSRLWHIVGREIGVGVVCGLFYAVLLGSVVAIVYSDFPSPLMLAATVGLSVLVAMVIAAVVGGSIPLLFERLHIDPAIAAGPFVTTSVDVLGILAYFMIAKTLLGI